MSDLLDKHEVRALLADTIRQSGGSMNLWAINNGIPVSVVCDTLKGRRDPSETVANALGLIRVPMFRSLRKNANDLEAA